jgi:hypothetical protein
VLELPKKFPCQAWGVQALVAAIPVELPFWMATTGDSDQIRQPLRPTSELT